jgi:hypothetical protein
MTTLYRTYLQYTSCEKILSFSFDSPSYIIIKCRCNTPLQRNTVRNFEIIFVCEIRRILLVRLILFKALGKCEIHTKIWSVKLVGSSSLERNKYIRMILTCILEKYALEVWIGFDCLRIVSNGGFLITWCTL